MAMPGIPAPQGGDGQINVASPFEANETGGCWPPEQGDDRPVVPVGSQQHGPSSPTHGASGGIEVDYGSVAPVKFHRRSQGTSRSAALGTDLGKK